MYFILFALAAHGVGISGGDRIMIELARRWSKKIPITIHVWEEGEQMLTRQHLRTMNYELRITGKNKNGVFVHVSKLKKYSRFGFAVGYLARIVEGIRLGFTMDLSQYSSYGVKRNTYLYSASDFWMDVLPCAILKLRHPKKVKWIAGWYQTAPNPITGFSGGRYKLSALLYFLSQLPMKPLVLHLADFVFVNNESERSQFKKLNEKGKIFVFIGAVPLADIKKFLSTNYKLPSTKRYDAVFQGRFHPQKGVVELIDIWKLVVAKMPNAKLAMIGDGPLMAEVEAQITKYELRNNIELFGYVFDGDKKYKIFAQSKLVVHPAYYDSGGMASAEAMAFGLPCIGFDLPAYESYYPHGMIKVPLGDKQSFASKVVRVLENKTLRVKVGREATAMIEDNWSWDKRSQEVFNFISK